ncbi:MAG: hypothetical protein LBS46_04790 [Dysgonamonadaceae bacterium]|nr:hypothetical protein [Dysgonamonadaceae bacterium]
MDGVKKEKLRIEYPLDRVSKSSLWNCLSTPGGLSEWFADEVTDDGKIFTFTWGKHQTEAELVGMNPSIYIRFHWLDDEDDTYFEFRLHKIELTGDWMLEITDFAEEDEKEHAITLWNTQIKTLKRRLGL